MIVSSACLSHPIHQYDIHFSNVKEIDVPINLTNCLLHRAVSQDSLLVDSTFSSFFQSVSYYASLLLAADTLVHHKS